MTARLACLALLAAQAPGPFDRGLAAFRAGRWADAEAAFRQAVAEQPRSAAAWKYLGMTRAAQERHPDAVDPFRRACALDPREDGACYYLGRALYQLDRYDESKKAFETALRHGANRPRTVHGLAFTLEALGEHDAAERAFRDSGALKDYGLFLYRRGRAAEGLALLRRAGATAEADRVARALAAAPASRGAEPVPVDFAAVPLDGVVRNGATGNKHQVETMLAGAAVIDYNNDGRTDIFIANGAALPSLVKTDESFHDRLYRNNGNGTFTHVEAGVAGEGYSMGAAAADYDGDGWTDLFVTGVRRNTLYRNRGDGTFEDVSARAGLRENGGWTIAAGWFDYDNDGRLDLFVVRYVRWDPAAEPYCGDPRPGYRAYCHPKHYTALPNALYRNQGDGTFRDVSAESGIGAHAGKGMGVVFGDYDADGRMDVFVANDTVPNFLFHNEGGGRFRESAMEAGVALNEAGLALSTMGADFRDYDNDGREDLFVTTLTNERFVLFRNIGGRFVDVSAPALVATQSLPWSGWSTGMFDLNNDGFKDIFVAQGNVMDNAELTSSRTSRQPNAVYLNRGGSFRMQLLPGEAFHRGAAFGDLDGDGRMDAVVTRLNETPLVLLNRTRNAGRWIALRGPIGTRVRIGEQFNRITTSVGFACSSDAAAHFGLGSLARVPLIEVELPSGARRRLENVAADQTIVVNP